MTSQTLTSIKYEVIRRLGVRAPRPRPALPLEKGESHAYSLRRAGQGSDPCHRKAPSGDDETFFRKIFQQGEALPPELSHV